jgi:hypothetical protein
MKKLFIAFCILSMFTSLDVAFGQTSKQRRIDSINSSRQNGKTDYNADTLLSDSERVVKLNIDEIHLNLSKKKYAIEHERKVYDFQYYTSIIIFAVVIFIVLTGLYLSYKQFEFTHEMLRNQTDAKKAIIIQGPDATTKIIDDTTSQETKADISLSGSTTFELSKDGIKINSAVIGLIILAISIAFFFLYLEYVYPVHVIK